MALQIPNDAVDIEAIEGGDSLAVADGLRTILNAVNGLLTRPRETGKWTPYTPIWSSTSGGTGSIGNGTLEGRYSIVGDVVFFNFDFVWGSTSSSPHATAQWTFSLPTTVTATARFVGIIVDSSTNTGYATFAYRDTTTANLLLLRTYAGADAAVSLTSPVTWASGDFIRISGVAEVSS